MAKFKAGDVIFSDDNQNSLYHIKFKIQSKDEYTYTCKDIISNIKYIWEKQAVENLMTIDINITKKKKLAGLRHDKV